MTTPSAVSPSPEPSLPSAPAPVTPTPGRPSVVARLLLAVLRLYQATAVMRQPRCRFHPTCSTYAVESIQVHGAARGLGLAIRRISRCHPWHPGGVDPVKPRN